MLTNIDLRELSELSGNDKTFLSIYFSGPDSLKNLEKRFAQIRRVLESKESGPDEKEHFEENVNLVREYLKNNKLKSGSLCIFSCWGLDFFRTYKLTLPVKDLVRFDSSPYIRPLAELKDEYENSAVVIADNKKARIFLISSAIADHEATVHGNIKNHVKKGGWSQQRYERRRDKQLLLYAREIVDALTELEKNETFTRVILVGGKEIMRIIYDNLPPHLLERVEQKAVDLHKDEKIINNEIMELFFEQERKSEQDLWQKIRAEYLRDGLGITGITDVLAAVKIGRIEEILVNRDYKIPGKRCRKCENLEEEKVNRCANCGSDSLFTVDLVNEIVEEAQKTGASVDFCDPIQSLKEAGDIAAFLRYKY
ncbi:MAG: hypothetical protein KAT34_18110 [Candidatus Aminicenantes bacterium]|nr:hypothetical protein [Candidatus Aminicenantes bacterium]